MIFRPGSCNGRYTVSVCPSVCASVRKPFVFSATLYLYKAQCSHLVHISFGKFTFSWPFDLWNMDTGLPATSFYTNVSIFVKIIIVFINVDRSIDWNPSAHQYMHARFRYVPQVSLRNLAEYIHVNITCRGLWDKDYFWKFRL